MPSTGLAAMHKIALPYSDVPQKVEEYVNPDFNHKSHARMHARLLNPQPEVDKTLESAGLKLSFKVFNNLDSALASFH